MAFSLSFAGVCVNISPSICSSSSFLSGVRHCDGRIEADLSNFSGTITLTEDLLQSVHRSAVDDVVNAGSFKERKDSAAGTYSTSPGEEDESIVTVDAVPESASRDISFDVLAALKHDGYPNFAHSKIQDPYYPPEKIRKNGSITIDNADINLPEKIQANGNIKVENVDTNYKESISYPSEKVQIMKVENVDTNYNKTISYDKLSFHEACASEDVSIEELHMMLRHNPDVASVRDQFGDYPAHIFANNDVFIYTTDCDEVLVEFLIELYSAYPGAFFAEGRSGRIPFAAAIVDWIDDCHQLYRRDAGSVYRVSELKTLSHSDRVINDLCVRREVQMLSKLPERVTLTPKVSYSFKMLSALLDRLSDNAFQHISQRKEFFLTSWKRRDKIIRSVAAIPFLVRTILLIDSSAERDALLQTTIVKNAMFCVETVGLWLVSLLGGCSRSRNCATYYLCLVSRSSISGLYGKETQWSCKDIVRFHGSRKDLYDGIGKLSALLPTMLHLEDQLYEVSTRRSVKHVVEMVERQPFVVYLKFSEMIGLLLLICSYRIIIELLYNTSEPIGTSYHEFWGLAVVTVVFFALQDLGIMLAFLSTDANLWKRHMRSVSNIVSIFTTLSVFVSLGMIYADEEIRGRNFLGIVMGLLWWKFILHVKGMSSSLATLIYTILQIASSLKYFLLFFLILIICFADTVQIVLKTSEQCDGDADFETMCSLTPVESYVAMYGIMIGGVDISSISDFSPLVIVLFIAATFLGLIILVNILIAIVTSEYERACENSRALFARARLEQAARHVAREKFFKPNGDSRHNTAGLKVWRRMWKAVHLAIFSLQEFFLIKSLISCNQLRKEGIIDLYFFVCLVIFAMLHHVFIAASAMTMSAVAIKKYKCLAWLEDGKFHCFVKIGVAPVCYYLRSIGLFESESCPDCDAQ